MLLTFLFLLTFHQLKQTRVNILGFSHSETQRLSVTEELYSSAELQEHVRLHLRLIDQISTLSHKTEFFVCISAYR